MPKKREKKASPSPVGLSAAEVAAGEPSPEVRALEEGVRADGGSVLAHYREPFGGRWLVLASLPIEQVEPTPFQRDLSKPHVGRLVNVIGRIGRFLDPIIAVREGPGRYWTPNGGHRLAAMKEISAKAILALLVPELSAAFQILALNTEKAHNLREKSLEVIRMYLELAKGSKRAEEEHALEFEEASYVTLGLCYEARPKFSGGAYHPFLKRADQFLSQPLSQALTLRRQRAEALLAIDDLVTAKVERLRARGFSSPYLKNFVVARINPIRFQKKGSEPPPFEEALERMRKSAEKFDPERVRPDDLSRLGGAPGEELS